MASCRRTSSPRHDRHYQNGNAHRVPSSSVDSPLSSALCVKVSGFFGTVFLEHSPRKSWRRCLLFFVVGFLLGMAPFGYDNDLQANVFSFEMKLDHVNAQLEEKPDEPQIKQDDPVIEHVHLEVQGDPSGRGDDEFGPLKQLIVITPTYNRAPQAYFLNRVGQALRLVKPPLLWIVVEMDAASMETSEILRTSGVMYRHLVCKKNVTSVEDTGDHQRNTALEHIEFHQLDGVVYFADDDNVYSLELFEGLRQISRFGAWPVARLAPGKNKPILEGPVCNRSLVIGWHPNEKSKSLRRFHVYMPGFAFNSTILWDPKRWQRTTLNPIRQLDTVEEGFRETTFVGQVVDDESQMEAIPPTCSRIMNWHLHLEARRLYYPKGWLLQKNLDAAIPI